MTQGYYDATIDDTSTKGYDNKLILYTWEDELKREKTRSIIKTTIKGIIFVILFIMALI